MGQQNGKNIRIPGRVQPIQTAYIGRGIRMLTDHSRIVHAAQNNALPPHFHCHRCIGEDGYPVLFQDRHFPPESLRTASVFVIACHVVSGVLSGNPCQKYIRICIGNYVVKNISAQQNHVRICLVDRLGQHLLAFSIAAGMQIGDQGDTNGSVHLIRLYGVISDQQSTVHSHH